MHNYHETLIQTILENSVSRNWANAVNEWNIVDCIEDEYNESSCICGKENLRYLFTIKNMRNGNILFPIGSTCIKKFDRADLNEQTSVNEKLFQLLHAIQGNEFISLNSKFFSRKLLKFLYIDGAFVPTRFNGNDGENDYYFILDMFNKRTNISEKQESKIKAVIVTSIKPYLVRKLSNKIK